MNIAAGNARVGEQIGSIGTRIDHVYGSVHVGSGSADLRAQLADLVRALADHRAAGRIDEATFAAAGAELAEASTHAASADAAGRGTLVLALRRLKGLVEDVADLATRVTTAIVAARTL